jgi:hypothetical protein
MWDGRLWPVNCRKDTNEYVERTIKKAATIVNRESSSLAR